MQRLSAWALVAVLSVVVGCTGPSLQVPVDATNVPRTPRPVVPLPTARPPTASPVTSPTATPNPDEAAVIAAFLADFAQEEPSFHVDSDVLMTISAGTESKEYSMSLSGDVAGQDFAGELSLANVGSLRLRFVDGVAYTRPAGQPWKVAEEFRQTQPLNPFGLLEADDLHYVGKASGRRGSHHLRTLAWIGGELKVAGLSNVELQSTVFDIYVSNDGVPVQAILDFAISGRSASGFTRLDYHVDYRFSDVGEPVEIRAPI